MKLPTSFVPKKNLDGITEQLAKSKYPNPRIYKLVASCKEFLIKKEGKNIPVAYTIGTELAEELSYTTKDLEELSQRIIIGTLDYNLGIYQSKKDVDKELGLYFSALINKILENQYEIILKLNVELDALGMFQKGGTIIIQGDVESRVGFNKTGGILIVEGNTGICAGACMLDGKLIVKGDTGKNTGFFMNGGEMHVDGEIGSISERCYAKVYQRNELVWPG